MQGSSKVYLENQVPDGMAEYAAGSCQPGNEDSGEWMRF